MKEEEGLVASIQPQPTVGSSPAIWDLVMDEMRERDRIGKVKYGVRLQADNGRDALRDLLDELLDAAVYTRSLIYQRDGK